LQQKCLYNISKKFITVKKWLTQLNALSTLLKVSN
jgi:hypothetical protein